MNKFIKFWKDAWKEYIEFLKDNPMYFSFFDGHPQYTDYQLLKELNKQKREKEKEESNN